MRLESLSWTLQAGWQRQNETGSPHLVICFDGACGRAIGGALRANQPHHQTMTIAAIGDAVSP